MGGGGVKAPQPTAEERELQKNQANLLALQTEILKQQRAQQAVLLPYFAEQEGVQIETDEFGNVTRISKTPTELETKRKELELAYTNRSLAAIKGELPVSPGLERDLGKTEQTLRERLGKQLGPGWETSSPGIEAIAKNSENANIIREAARSDQMTLAEQLGLARQQQNEASRMNQSATISQGAIGNPLQLAGAFGATATGYGKAQEPFIRQREMQLQASIANQQSRGQMIGAGIGLIGGLFSDARLKSEIAPVSELCRGISIVTFKFDHEGPNAPRRLGVLAQDVQAVFPDCVGEEQGFLTINPKALVKAAAERRAYVRQRRTGPNRGTAPAH